MESDDRDDRVSGLIDSGRADTDDDEMNIPGKKIVLVATSGGRKPRNEPGLLDHPYLYQVHEVGWRGGEERIIQGNSWLQSEQKKRKKRA